MIIIIPLNKFYNIMTNDNFNKLNEFVKQESSLLDYYTKSLNSEYINGRKFEFELIVKTMRFYGINVQVDKDKSIRLDFDNS